ncbi:MAG: hypothetical protein ACRC5H_07275, partial [Treponemataceae bacterium]
MLEPFISLSPYSKLKKMRGDATEEKVLKGFRLCPVFRVEDTQGENLVYQTRMKELNIEELPLIDVAKKLGVKVVASLCRQAEGSFSPSENTIRLNCADKQVFLHELSHSIDFKINGHDKDHYDYALGEVVAELSSAFLGSLYGVTIDLENTKAYIQAWAGKEHIAFKVVEAVGRVEKI